MTDLPTQLPPAVSTTTCPTCGSAAEPGASFCESCGSALPAGPVLLAAGAVGLVAYTGIFATWHWVA